MCGQRRAFVQFQVHSSNSMVKKNAFDTLKMHQRSITTASKRSERQRAGKIVSPAMANRVTYSVNKHRKVEESCKFTLPEQYRKIALQELNEDDVVREQALTRMREWIVSNPHIRKCRVDAPFLLRFLRFRKFSVPMACEALEQYLTVREMYPSWYKNLDCNDPAVRRMQENMGVSVLGQNTAGRTVVLMQVIQMERAQLTPLQEGRFLFMMLEALLELEEVQIGGILLLLDYTGISMDTYEGWGASEVKIAFDGIARFYPVRYQEIHAANVPKVVDSFVEYLISVAPTTFRERIHCHDTADKLKELIEPSMTPYVYGGGVDLDKMNKKFWQHFLQPYEGFALGLDKFEIDLDYYSTLWNKENPDKAEGFQKAKY